TRPVAFILSGDMAVAYFYAHAPRGFYPLLNAGELAALYCFVFLYLAAAGGGEWSLDHLWRGGPARTPVLSERPRETPRAPRARAAARLCRRHTGRSGTGAVPSH